MMSDANCFFKLTIPDPQSEYFFNQRFVSCDSNYFLTIQIADFLRVEG